MGNKTGADFLVLLLIFPRSVSAKSNFTPLNIILNTRTAHPTCKIGFMKRSEELGHTWTMRRDAVYFTAI